MCFIIIDGYILYIPILIYLTMSLLMVNKVSDISYLKVMLWTFSHIHSCIFSSYFFGSISASGSAVSKVTDIRILIPMARWLPKKLTNLQSQWKERVLNEGWAGTWISQVLCWLSGLPLHSLKHPNDWLHPELLPQKEVHSAHPNSPQILLLLRKDHW